MTTKTKLEVRRGEIRARLAEIGAAEDEANKEELRSLKDEYTDTENKLAALAIAEDGKEEHRVEEKAPDAEDKERAGLVRRARLSNYVTRAAEGIDLEGAEKELNAAFKLPVGAEVRIPLALLDDDSQAPVEDRADAVSELSIDTMKRPASWLSRVFMGTASEFLGIRRQAVSGVPVYPVITAGATAETVAKGAAKDAEEIAITVEEMKPKRVSARYVFAKEDAARLGPATYEEALRADLRQTMTTEMDKEILNGKGTLIKGLAGELTANPDAALADATTADGFASKIFALVDGKYALKTGDVRFLARPSFYTYLLTLAWTIGTTDSTHFLPYFKSVFNVDCMASGHIPEITGQSGESYIYACLARGKAGAAVQAVWDSMELIRDPYTDASKGQVALTAVGLHDFKVIRAANFAKIRVASS